MLLLPELAVGFQCRVIMGLQLGEETSLQGSEFLGGSAWMWFRRESAALTPLLEGAFDRRSGHPKHLDDVGTLISLIDSTKDAFSQIRRRRFHWLSPYDTRLLLLFLLSFYHWLKNSAYRCKYEDQFHALT